MLSNAYLLAKFRFDTAENEPAKNLQNFEKIANTNPSSLRSMLMVDAAGRPLPSSPGATPNAASLFCAGAIYFVEIGKRN